MVVLCQKWWSDRSPHRPQYLGRKTLPIKRADAEPLTRRDIQYDLLYFIFAYLSYRFIFNHDMMKHPKFLKDQVRLEIISSLKAFPLMTLLTLPFFMLEVKGYSKMYNDVSEYGWGYLVFSVFL